jgi:hypothetical protein
MDCGSGFMVDDAKLQPYRRGANSYGGVHHGGHLLSPPKDVHYIYPLGYRLQVEVGRLTEYRLRQVGVHRDAMNRKTWFVPTINRIKPRLKSD